MEDRPTDRPTDLGIKAPSRSLKKETFRISFELKAPLKCREWVCEAYIFCTTHVCFRYVSVCEGFQLPQWQDWLRMQENPNWGQSVTAADEIEKLHFLFTLFNSFFLEGGHTGLWSIGRWYLTNEYEKLKYNG